MDNENSTLCMGCMNPKKGIGACPYCGYNENDTIDSNYITPGTWLDSRYLVGALKHKNGEGATYIGFDKEEQKSVWIREYFPFTIANRNPQTGEIQANTGRGAQFKALQSDFMELCNEVRRLSVSDPVVPVENMLGENNTIYVISTYIDAIPLEEYLVVHGGNLTTEDANSLLIPLINGVDNVHMRGLIHRGLSPYTVLVDKEREIYIDGFALSATRTGGSELQAELYNGYSAPEQYASTGWQGTWTDVYALATIYYRSVSGVVPPKATRIRLGEPLAPLKSIVSGIDEKISDAVAAAMDINAQSRTQTVAGFLSELLAEEGFESTAVFDPGRFPIIPNIETISYKDSGGHTESISAPEELETFRAEFRRSQNQPPNSNFNEDSEESFDSSYEELDKKSSRIGLAVAIVAVILVGGILAVVVNGMMGKNKPEKAPEEPPALIADSDGEEQEEDELLDPDKEKEITQVPKFVGRKRTVVEHHQDYKSTFDFEFKEEYSSEYDKGVISDQSLKEGEEVKEKTKVILTVSKGGKTLEMPNLVGKEYEQALQELARLAESIDLTVDDLKVQSIDRFQPGVEEGHIVSTYPVAGREFNPGKDVVEIHIGVAVPVKETEKDKEAEKDKEKEKEKEKSTSTTTNPGGPTINRPGWNSSNPKDTIDKSAELPTYD